MRPAVNISRPHSIHHATGRILNSAASHSAALSYVASDFSACRALGFKCDRLAENFGRYRRARAPLHQPVCYGR